MADLVDRAQWRGSPGCVGRLQAGSLFVTVSCDSLLGPSLDIQNPLSLNIPVTAIYGELHGAKTLLRPCGGQKAKVSVGILGEARPETWEYGGEVDLIAGSK